MCRRPTFNHFFTPGPTLRGRPVGVKATTIFVRRDKDLAHGPRVSHVTNSQSNQAPSSRSEGSTAGSSRNCRMSARWKVVCVVRSGPRGGPTACARGAALAPCFRPPVGTCVPWPRMRRLAATRGLARDREEGGKRADRPDSVRRFPGVAIIPLGDALLRRSSRQPACSRRRLVRRPGRARRDARMPIRRCFGWGFACHRCRHRRGELLPRLFNLAVRTSPRGPCVLGGVFSVPLSVALSLAACCAWPLASTLPCEVRTFLQRRASGQARDPAPAIAWPASRSRF